MDQWDSAVTFFTTPDLLAFDYMVETVQCMLLYSKAAATTIIARD
jgi:hypothetical protein